jgi:hypothetical protein
MLAMVSPLVNDLAGERERLLAIVCTVKPYTAVWEPAKGTCEQFAAADGVIEL